MKNKQTPKGFTAKAWSGMWNDGHLGWWMSEFIHPRATNSPATGLSKYFKPQTTYRVIVTIKLQRSKNGRLITKQVRPV